MSEIPNDLKCMSFSKNDISRIENEAYQQGRADAKKEMNEIMDMDLPISNILYEIDKWLKEQNE